MQSGDQRAASRGPMNELDRVVDPPRDDLRGPAEVASGYLRVLQKARRCGENERSGAKVAGGDREADGLTRSADDAVAGS